MAGQDDIEIMGAFSPPSGGAPPTRKAPFWRNRRVLAGLAIGSVLGGGILFFVHERKSSIVHTAAVPSAPTLPSPGEGVSKNPEYQRRIADQNERLARLAARTGQSSVPTIGGNARAGDISRSGETKPPVPAAPPRIDPGVELQAQEARRRALEAVRGEEVAAVDKEVAGILSTWSSGGDGLAVLSAPKAAPLPAGSPGNRSNTSPAAKTVSKKGVPIIPAGKILYGRIINELNSDHPGPVLAQAVGGTFDGVKFLGSFQRDHGALVIKFSQVIYTDGKPDSIGAYAVSPGAKLRSGLETDVNHHYLYRYGSLLASAFMQGFGESAMYSNSTSYPSTFGTPVIGFNGMTLLQQSEMGLGQAGMMLSGQAQNAFNTPTTVKVAANTPVGLMIVAETGQKLPKESSSTGAQAAKPGLVNAPVPSMVPQPGYPATPMTGGAYPGYGGGYGYGMPMMPMMP